MDLSSFVLPVLLALAAAAGLRKRIDVYGSLTAGAQEGLTLLLRILPNLVMLLTAIGMFRACGALDRLAIWLSPLLQGLGIPPETAALMLTRPISGSGGLAVASELIQTYGPDSYIGRVTAVMLGSTETTFYTIAVYFGAAGIRKSRYALWAALAADFAGFAAAAFTVRLFFGQ